MNELVELARLREEPLTVGTVSLLVREPSGFGLGDYRRALLSDPKATPPVVGDRFKACAVLLLECTRRLDGTPYFTAEEADVVARGRAEVFAPLVGKIMGYLGKEKKTSTTAPSDDSSTDSPPPSGAPSPN